MRHFQPQSAIPTHPLHNANRLKLGLFAMNCSGGLAATTIPQRWRNTYANNLAVAQLADEAGFEFLLPIARYIGYGGASGFHDDTLDPIAWAGALLAKTRRIGVFATIHACLHHPVTLAKQIATLDEIGAGRAGLNVVVGWNQPEFEALGTPLATDRTRRYAQAGEWLDVVTRLWRETAPFDFAGEFFSLRGVRGAPRPLRDAVPIFNAAMSEDGREFAIEHSDYLFTAALDLRKAKSEIESMRARGVERGRDIGCLAFAHVVCRPDAREARAFYLHYAQRHADREAVERLVAAMLPNVKSMPPAAQEMVKFSFAAGHGSHALVGDADAVASQLAALAASGFDGVALGFVDYLDELPFFVSEVLPRLESLGLRLAAKP